MKKKTWLAGLMAVGLGSAPVTALASELEINPHVLKTQSGAEVDVEWGEFDVPLYHDDPSKGSITLSFIRFPSTSDNPGPPMVYLAGGPGGVGTNFAAGHRHDLFMALRQLGDVIAFNQRGTGPTSTLTNCAYSEKFEGDLVVTGETFINYYKEMAAYCNGVWAEKGSEIAAYNTWESAGDLEALREVLGTDQLNLWGISYGTHLALAALKRNPDSYGRVVLVSPEGLDQTVKMPARSEAYFERVQEMINNHPDLKDKYANWLPTLRGVLAELRENPKTVTFTPRGSDTPVTMTFDNFPVQGLISFGFISDPGRLGPLLQLTYAMAAGAYEPIAGIIYQNFVVSALQGKSAMSGMPTAMDAASGISPEKLAAFNEQASNSVIGEAQNFPYPALFGVVDVPDLGEDFRSSFESDVPTLIFTGTLDGRTFPEAHAEVMENLNNSQQIIVKNGGHNLFMIDPKVTEIILEFFRGNEIDTETIVVPAPNFQ